MKNFELTDQEITAIRSALIAAAAASVDLQQKKFLLQLLTKLSGITSSDYLL